MWHCRFVATGYIGYTPVNRGGLLLSKKIRRQHEEGEVVFGKLWRPFWVSWYRYKRNEEKKEAAC